MTAEPSGSMNEIARTSPAGESTASVCSAFQMYGNACQPSAKRTSRRVSMIRTFSVGFRRSAGEREALHDHGADREVERQLRFELRASAPGRDVDRALLERVVGEERRVEIVGDDPVVEGERSGLSDPTRRN